MAKAWVQIQLGSYPVAAKAGATIFIPQMSISSSFLLGFEAGLFRLYDWNLRNGICQPIHSVFLQLVN